MSGVVDEPVCWGSAFILCSFFTWRQIVYEELRLYPEIVEFLDSANTCRVKDQLALFVYINTKFAYTATCVESQIHTLIQYAIDDVFQ